MRSKQSPDGPEPLAGLENVRLRSKSILAKREKKDCDFLCGVHNYMMDDFSPTADINSPEYLLMRWAYSDGSGANCNVCERVWQTELAHDWGGSREEYKGACARDLKLLENQRTRRKAWVERKKQNRAYINGRRRGGVKKTVVKTRNQYC